MLSFRLDPLADVPLQDQLYARLRAAILAGRLAPGWRLPSTRSLASELGLARGTVEVAYQRLAGEGYLLTRGAAGSFVHPALAVESPPDQPRPRPRALASAALGPSETSRPLQLGLPALDAFPRKLWARLAAGQARSLAQPDLLAQNPLGQAELRRAIAAYLAVSRGIVCAPEQVVVTAGYQGALGLIAQVLLTPGAPVWLEEPGYFRARAALRAAAAEPVPVPVDAEGLQVETGEALAPEARLALVTPTHHFPLGVTLSLARRLALLAWATRRAAWIVEDDYDSEFRYEGRPLPALKSLDAQGRVLYVGTFSKVLFPGLRLGYLVVPESLLPAIAETAGLLQPAAGAATQALVAAFMEAGHFARHITRMRKLYAARRAALVRAVTATCGARLPLRPLPGGLHLLATMAEDDQALAARASAAGLGPEALSKFYAGRPLRRGLLLGFANTPAEEAPAVAERLRALL